MVLRERGGEFHQLQYQSGWTEKHNRATRQESTWDHTNKVLKFHCRKSGVAAHLTDMPCGIPTKFQNVIWLYTHWGRQCPLVDICFKTLLTGIILSYLRGFCSSPNFAVHTLPLLAETSQLKTSQYWVVAISRNFKPKSCVHHAMTRSKW